MNGASTRSILVGILVLAKRRLTAAQIIALGRPLQLSATNIKSHLTRLTAEGVLSRTGSRRSQRYWLSTDRERGAAKIAASLAQPPEEKWTGDWIIVAMNPPRDRSSRERLRAELWADGFRPCAPGAYLRPAWPMPWVIDRARAIAPTALCLIGNLAGTIRLAQVQKMYGLDAFDRQARRLATQIRAESREARSPAAAFRARLHIGGLAARLIAHDPRLPPQIWQRRRGLQDVREAFRSFEARIGGLADRFVDGVIGSEEAVGMLLNPRLPKGHESRRGDRRLSADSVSRARELLRGQIKAAPDGRVRSRPQNPVEG
jgi:DNA-binding transcriptional regulator PaaX